MKCPKDDSVLMVVDKQGIEIDYCPKCEGVWLDHQELEKLINVAGGEARGSGIGDHVQTATDVNDAAGNPLADIFDFFGGADI